MMLSISWRTCLVAAGFLSWNLVIADPSYGCSGHLPKPVEWDATPGEVKMFRVNDRPVRVTVPESYNKTKPAPMIIAFHDKDQPPEHLEYDGQWTDPKVNKDVIMVYPTAENDRWMSDISPRKKTEKKPTPKASNRTADIQFTHFLVKDMENLLCVDTSRIYAMGMGVGGGMMHMIACSRDLSTSFAAYAVVGGVFGRSKEGKRPWGVCTPKRQIPLVEIHGLEDRIAAYYLKEGENGKKRTIPPHWLDDWAERNSCGERDGDAVQSSEDETTFISKLENGFMTETAQYGGSAIRIAKKCNPQKRETETPKPHNQEEEREEEQKKKDSAPTVALKDEETTILHYQIKYFGHGWPRQHLKRQKEVILNDKQIKVKDDTFFDTTKIIMNFFDAHKLEDEFAKRESINTGSEINPPSEQEMAEKMAEQMAKLGKENAEFGKKKLPSEAEIAEKLKQFNAAQEKMKKMNPGDTDEIARDEL